MCEVVLRNCLICIRKGAVLGNYLVCVIEKVLCNLKGFVFNICLKIVGSALGKNLLLQIIDLRWERSCV